MNKRDLGIALLAVGIVILLESLFGDLVGIGGAPGFGYKQILGSIAGIVAAAIGYVLYYRK